MITLADIDLKKISDSELGQLLVKAKKAYYTTAKPIMDDHSYDTLEQALRRRAPYHRLFTTVGNPNFNTGFAKESHAFILGSQNKTATFDQLVHYFELQLKRARHVSTDQVDYVVQPKCDGISLEIQYKKGKLDQAITRGNGRVGDLITQNVVNMKNVVLKSKQSFSGSIRAEVVVTFADFKKLNKISDQKYSNPRNAAAGIAQRLDGKLAEFCSLFAVDIYPSKKTEMAGIKLIQSLGIKTVDSHHCQNFKQIETVYQDFLTKSRSTYPFDIDGLVVKINNSALQESLGSHNLRPKGQVAYKFPAATDTTTIKAVSWQVGPLGHLTPVAQVEPIQISGAVINFASLGNKELVKSKNINLGDIVKVSRRGDVIPYVEKVINKVKKGHAMIPKVCPSCQKPLKKSARFLDCTNPNCPGQHLGRLKLFAQKLDMLGLSDKTINRLIQAGKIRLPGDFFKLKMADIAPLERLAQKSAQNLISQIQAKRKLTLEQALTAISIPHLSRARLQQLVRAGFDTPQKILDLRISDLTSLPGFKQTLSQKIISGLKVRRPEIHSVLAQVKIKNLKLKIKNSALKGLKIAITGTLNKPRPETENAITAAGGQVVSSVSQNTDYLVTEDTSSSSTKFQKAKKFKTKIISENKLNQMLS